MQRLRSSRTNAVLSFFVGRSMVAVERRLRQHYKEGGAGSCMNAGGVT